MSEAKSESPLSIITGFAVIAGIFMMGRCSNEPNVQAFGPTLAPPPSNTEFVLGPPGYELFSPPKQFYSDVRVPVSFLLPESVSAACGNPDDWSRACTKLGEIPEIVLPNPCRFREDETYAQIACHELAHINGWRHPDRGDADFPWEKFEGTKYCRPPMLCKAAKP